MADKKKKKDDEKIEMAIRALLKLPENKRCINCNLLGPQYVCTTFSTFVCTTCSGIHREFTHRVKSVSMAKFTEEEVSVLQEAGNELARKIYFKAWDPQRHSFPDSSNLHMLRNFIKHVYVDLKYAGERSEMLPSLGLGYKADSPQSRKVSVFTGRSKSPPYEGRHERSSNEGSSPAGRSGFVRGLHNETRSHPYAQENSRYVGSPRNHRHIEIVDNRRRDGHGGSPRNHRHIEIIDNRRRRDGPGSAIRKDNHSISQREPVTRSGSFDHQLDRSASPVVRPIREILGENAPALQVGEHLKENSGRDLDTSAKNQKISSSSGIESLIDFSMDSEPSNTVAEPNMQQVPPSSDGGNQSLDEVSSKGKAPHAVHGNYLNLLLFDLSAPSVESVVNVSAVPGTASAPSTASGQNISLNSISPATHEGQLLALTSTNCSSPVPLEINVPQVQSPNGHVFPSMQKHQSSMFSAFNDTFSPKSTQTVEALHSGQNISLNSGQSPHGHVFPSMQKHQSFIFSAFNDTFSAESTRTVEALNSQPSTSFLMHNTQQSSNLYTEQPPEATSKSGEDTSFKDRVQPLSAETKSGERKELTQEIFTASYGPTPAAVPGWETGLPHGAGFGLNVYPNAMHAAAFPSITKTNLFDLNSDTTKAQAPPFPSMEAFLGVLPIIQNPIALSHTPSIDAQSSEKASPSHLAFMTTPEPASTLAMPSSAYMGNQSLSGVPPSRPQGIGGLGSDEPNSGFLNATHRSAGGKSASSPPNSFPTMGPNLFG